AEGGEGARVVQRQRPADRGRAPLQALGARAMSMRLERVAGEVRAVLGDVLARDEIKDPRVRGAGLITVTHVRVSGDLRHARAMFTVHDADGGAAERARQRT